MNTAIRLVIFWGMRAAVQAAFGRSDGGNFALLFKSQLGNVPLTKREN